MRALRVQQKSKSNFESNAGGSMIRRGHFAEAYLSRHDKTNPPGLSDGLNSEYRFDYTRAKPNRFAGRPRLNPVAVILAPDVAAVFKDGESVNAVLRSIVKALPRTGAVD